ncbi:MAG: hypothetical protein AAB037_02880 [Chloroflexota bacterium]
MNTPDGMSLLNLFPDPGHELAPSELPRGFGVLLAFLDYGHDPLEVDIEPKLQNARPMFRVVLNVRFV